MNCPKCKAAMETVSYRSVEVERCTRCAGLWFDLLEEETLKMLSGAEAIDSGDAKTGKAQNRTGNIRCPKCSVDMLRMVVADQPHIWYESCPVCYGTWFDAGEFTDYKQETFIDKVRDLLAGERK